VDASRERGGSTSDRFRPHGSLRSSIAKGPSMSRIKALPEPTSIPAWDPGEAAKKGGPGAPPRCLGPGRSQGNFFRGGRLSRRIDGQGLVTWRSKMRHMLSFAVRGGCDQDQHRSATCLKVTPHWGRHNAASHLTMKGLADSAVQRGGGWQTPAMLRRYQHLAPEASKDLANALDFTRPRAKRG